MLVIKCVMISVLSVFAQKKTHERILNGHEDIDNEFYFVVSLHLDVRMYNSDIPVYSGFLLSDTYVLTAAHCLSKSLKRVRYREDGALHANVTHYSNIIKTTIHPGRRVHYFDYNLIHSRPVMYSYNDVALLQIEPAINVKKFPKLSAMEYTTMVGREVKMGGYGLPIDRFDKNMIMKYNIYDVLMNRKLLVGEGIIVSCKEFQTLSYQVPSFCVVGRCSEIRQKASSGSSGGPVLYDGMIVGFMTAIGKIESICTPVSPFIGWIQDVMSRDQHHVP